MSTVNHFRKKIVSSQRNIDIIQILCRVPPKLFFLEGISCLYVENFMHMLDPFFFQIKSWCLHIRYCWPYLGIWPNRFCT